MTTELDTEAREQIKRDVYAAIMRERSGAYVVEYVLRRVEEAAEETALVRDTLTRRTHAHQRVIDENTRLRTELADRDARLATKRQCRNCGWDVTVEP